MNKQKNTFQYKKSIAGKRNTAKVRMNAEVTESFGNRVLRWLLQPANQIKNSSHLLLAILMFVLGFLLYANTFTHEYALDDDLVYKLNNSVKKGIDGVPEIFRTTNMYGFNQQNFGAYRPFTQMIFALEYEFFGLNPHIQHLISVLLFALTSALLYILLRRMFSDKPVWITLAISLLFIAHPIHTEVVANIKSGDEIFSFLLGFVLTFLALFKYIDSRKPWWLAMSLFAFLLGLLSKEHIVTLIPLVPLSLYFFSDRKPLKILIISLWFLIPAAIFMVLRILFIESYTGKIVFLDNFIIYITPFSEKVGTILYVLLQYLRLGFFPFPQSCDYSWAQTPQLSLFSLLPIISAIIYLGIIAIAIILFRKKNLLSWCILFFLFTISIYSHIYAGLASTIAERFLFTPSLPIIIAFILLLQKTAEFGKNHRIRSAILIWPVVVVFIIFSVKTIARNTIWKNSDTLFLNDVENAPNSARLNKSAGDVYINLGKDEKDIVKKKEIMRKALVYLNRAYTIYPEYPDNLLDLGTAWYYIGEYDTAWNYWKRFAIMQPWSPRCKQNIDYLKSGYYVMGQELGKQGRSPEAINAFKKSLQYDSLFHPSWFNLGLVYANIKEYSSSMNCMQKALKLDSTNAEYWYNYGGLLFTIKDIPNARSAWKKTIELNPNHTEALKGLQALELK